VQLLTCPRRINIEERITSSTSTAAQLLQHNRKRFLFRRPVYTQSTLFLFAKYSSCNLNGNLLVGISQPCMDPRCLATNTLKVHDHSSVRIIDNFRQSTIGIFSTPD
jgi:hypothetical protein